MWTPRTFIRTLASVRRSPLMLMSCAACADTGEVAAIAREASIAAVASAATVRRAIRPRQLLWWTSFICLLLWLFWQRPNLLVLSHLSNAHSVAACPALSAGVEPVQYAAHEADHFL